MSTLAPIADRASAAQPTRYTVRAGDTLSEIAQSLGVLLRDLLAANPQITNADHIRTGQQIQLPGANPSASSSAASAPSASASAQSLGLSQNGLNLIKGFEGLRLSAYQDSAGVWTIGYGHTGGVRPGQRISQAQAEQYLRSDVRWAEQAVRDNVKVPLSQNQFDALVSFTFNVGAGALKDSTLLKKLNAGDYAGAQAEFGRWVNAGGQRLEGLVRRRAEEAQLFGSVGPAVSSTQQSPQTSPAPSTPSAGTSGGYTVRAGDTLSDIARAHGVSLQSLIAANPQIRHPDLIFVGQRINLPGSASAGAGAPAAAPPAATTQPSGASATDASGRRYATSADGTPLFRQGDAAWGGRILGDDSSIASAGCAMVSVAMALSKISGRTITPAQLDSHLDRNGGYVGDALVWGKAASIIGASASKPGWSVGTINRQIDAGRPVVIGVDYKRGSNGGSNGTDHWITITGRGTANGKAVYYANDPATGQQITLSLDGGRLVGGPKGYRSTGELVVFSGGR